MHLLKKHKHLQNKCEMRRDGITLELLRIQLEKRLTSVSWIEMQSNIASHQHIATSILALLWNNIYTYIQVYASKTGWKGQVQPVYWIKTYSRSIWM